MGRSGESALLIAAARPVTIAAPDNSTPAAPAVSKPSPTKSIDAVALMIWIGAVVVCVLAWIVVLRIVAAFAN